MDSDVREMVTRAEAGRLLNLTQSGVKSATMRGRLRATMHDGRWFVTLAEVERYRMYHLHAQGDSATVPEPSLHRKGHGGGRRPKSPTPI